jgi:CMP-N-acetylneuraminic acid synthetase
MNSNVVVVTARGGSQSIPHKNLALVAGRPSVTYPILAAKSAARIHEVFLYTDSEQIAAVARELDCGVIKRPKELCAPETNHGDAICAAIDEVKKRVENIGIVTVLLGDTVMVSSGLIDISVRILEHAPQWHSVMSVWQANDDHPFRALCLSPDGGLKSFLQTQYGDEGNFHTARQTYPPVFFYDQGIWTFRAEVARRKEGPPPWWWMGKNVFPLIRRWISGRDYHSKLDLDLAEWWINSGQSDVIENTSEIQGLLEEHSI